MRDRPRMQKLEKVLTILAVCTFALLGYGAKCGGGGGGGTSDKDEAAVINFRVKVDNGSAFANVPYTITVEFKGELQSGTGSTGNQNPFTLTQTFNGQTDSQGSYTVTKMATNERPGTWKLTVSTDLLNWSTNCQQTFQAGAITNANFTHSKNGCQLGLNFP